ncbi:hypothetical protein LINPERHAP1_LOCUS4749 [Linum perenne]
MRFGRKGKLAPRYIGPYEILAKSSLVSYVLELASELERIHSVFHVSRLKWYLVDPSHVMQPKEVDIEQDMTYEEKLVEIMDSEVRVLRNKQIPQIKVVWRNHESESAT